MGDIVSAGISAFDLGKRQSRLVVNRIGSVSALRVTPTKGRLLATDVQHRKVLILDMGTKLRPKVMPVAADLKRPSGLGFVDAGLLAVSDEGAGRIFFVSEKGQVVGQF